MKTSTDVFCPVCGAKPGRACTSRGLPMNPHDRRSEEAGRQNRDTRGRYDFSNLEALCRCGRRLGEHLAAAPRPMADDSCTGFKPAGKE